MYFSSFIFILFYFPSLSFFLAFFISPSLRQRRKTMLFLCLQNVNLHKHNFILYTPYYSKRDWAENLPSSSSCGGRWSKRKKYSNSKCDVREIISVASYRNFVTSRMITFLHSEIKSRYNILSYWSSPSTTRLKLNEMNEWKFHSHSLWEFSFSFFFC